MSVLLKQHESVSDSDQQSPNIPISEGDWAAYRNEIEHCRIDILSRQALKDVISYKRDCAFAYLGRRAQKNGGVCSRSQPRIFTARAIADLGQANAQARFSRYPWLEKLLKLMADIELIQDAISVQSNVISLPANHNYCGLANRSPAPLRKKAQAFSFESPSRA